MMDTLRALKDELKRDRVPAVAAGLAFYAMLAIFPALIALVSLYGLFSDPAQVESQLEQLYAVMPPSAADLIGSQMHALVAQSSGALGVGFLVSLLGLLWSASSGVSQLFAAINQAYEREETRSFLKVRGLAIGVTLALLVFAAAALALVALVPPALEALQLGGSVGSAITWLRWPLLALAVMLGLGWIYRLAPDRDGKPRWRWVSPGAVAATALWLAGSAAFSFYASRFGSYQETYGAIGAVIVFMMWLWISSLSVLVGAELNYIVERGAGRLAPERPKKKRELEQTYA